MPRPPRAISRRRFLAGAAAASGALLLGPQRVLARDRAPAFPSRPRPVLGGSAAAHLAWVWQFRHDGDLAEIRDVLAAHGLGIALKTHDGTQWMSRYDPSPEAVSGADQLLRLASYFEAGGVPFHCWCVVHGTDPAAEAEMAVTVLNAGARSLAIDLEPHPGFWRGTADSALRYGEAVRRVHPSAALVTSVDARPWEVDRVPMAEFASFTDAFAPQVYWGTFNTASNVRKYRLAGEDPGDGGVTAGFAIDSAVRALEPFGLPIVPIGDGTIDDAVAWREFVDESYARSAPAVSVWRYGVASTSIWELLRDVPPPVAETAYEVVAGDTLSAIAERWNVSVEDLAAANGITNPNQLSIGQVLHLPGAAPAPGLGSPEATAPPPSTSGAASGGFATHVVREGDSLWDLAWAWDTTPEAVSALNGITDPTLLQIGQVLLIP